MTPGWAEGAPWEAYPVLAIASGHKVPRAWRQTSSPSCQQGCIQNAEITTDPQLVLDALRMKT